MNRLFQLGFWAAIAVTAYFCFRPSVIALNISDKTEHAVTFGGLMLLAAVAWPRARLHWQAFALAGFGAFIEFVQPYFGRTKDVKDWTADVIGILIAVAMVWIVRRLLRRG